MGMSPRELEKLAKSIAEAVEHSQVPAKLVADVNQRMAEAARLPLQQLSDSMARSAQVLTADFAEKAFPTLREVTAQLSERMIEPQIQALEAFTNALPKITFSYPDLAKAIQFSVPDTDRLRELFQQFGHTVPDIAIDSSLLAALRSEAWDAARESSLDEASADRELGEVVRTIEEASDTLGGQDVPTDRSRAGLILMVLGVLFTFLAGQDEILENAFEDAALLSGLLGRVWPYAAAVLFALFMGMKLQRPPE
jgi:hypothetical protein